MTGKQREEYTQKSIKAMEEPTYVFPQCCCRHFGLNSHLQFPDNCITLLNVKIEKGYNTGPDPKENKLLSEINHFSSLKNHLKL